jgi:molybdopterin converting factor small subunit
MKMNENIDNSININIQYFAVLQEITGCASESISVQADSTPKTVYKRLNNQYGLPNRNRLKVVINDSFCSWESGLTNDDTIVFIPPVTGG